MGELPAFIDTVPDYEVRRGQMHITMGEFELVMPVSIYLEGMVRGEAAVAKWQLRELRREGNVVQIGRSRKH